MTLAEWLASRMPAPPPALSARLRDALVPHGEVPLDGVPERLLDAAERLLMGVLDAPAGSREAALDLLAADALVTYAFEAAAADRARLDERASVAMTRMAQIAAAADSR